MIVLATRTGRRWPLQAQIPAPISTLAGEHEDEAHMRLLVRLHGKKLLV